MTWARARSCHQRPRKNKSLLHYIIGSPTGILQLFAARRLRCHPQNRRRGCERPCSQPQWTSYLYPLLSRFGVVANGVLHPRHAPPRGGGQIKNKSQRFKGIYGKTVGFSGREAGALLPKAGAETRAQRRSGKARGDAVDPFPRLLNTRAPPPGACLACACGGEARSATILKNPFLRGAHLDGVVPCARANSKSEKPLPIRP